MTIWDCRTHVPMTSSVERTDLDFKISVALSMGQGNESLLAGSGSRWPRWLPRPYMVKTLQKSSSLEPKGQWPCGLVCSIGPSIVCSNDDPRLTLTYFTARSNLVSYAFIWGKLLESHLMEETYSKWPEWQKVYVFIKILTPRGCLPLPWGDIHVEKH